MKLVVKLVVSAAAVWAAVQLVDGLDFTGDWVNLALIAVILGFVNAVVRPVLKLIALPAIIATLGLFLLVVNAIAFGLTIWLSGELGLGLRSSGWRATFLGALVVTLVTWVADGLLGTDD